MGWRYPTSHNANTSQWHDPTNCYDGNLSTYGYDRIYPLPFTGYYIEFNIPEIQCNKIRFNAGNDDGDANKIDIDVYYDGSWHNVYYRGAFSIHVWAEVSFATHTVTKARVRFLTSQIWSGGQGWLYGFSFYEIVTETSWVNEPYAYDENTGSAATCITPSISWTPFLIYNLTPVYSALIKFIAKYDGGLGINVVDLDAYYDGSWHDIYSGSYLNGIWVEKALAEDKYISAIRVRFYNNGSSSATATLYELEVTQSIGVPKVTTDAATDVADALATLNGDITNTGGEVPTTRGFKYKEGIDGEETTTSESGYFAVGAYSKNLTGLDPTKKYYFKAYATNTEGTGYGEWKSFGVNIDIPTVTTSAATSVDNEKAVLNGEITETGGEDPEERGFEYKIGEEVIILTIRETGSFGVGAYSLDFDGLDPNIEYHFRAYAKNSAGTGYGAWLDLNTDYTDPMVRTHNATNELTTQVTGNGEIVSTGGHDCDERGFEYGLSKVATWTKKETAGGYGVGFFALTIDGLTANTEYWYRAYAKYFLGADDTKRTTSATNKDRPQLQVIGDTIYIIWTQPNQIWLGTMNIDGTGWTAVVLTGTGYLKTMPQFHIVDTKIYYIWKEYDGANYQIWTATSDLDGGNFVATKQTTSATNRYNPQLQVFGTKVYYVYEEKYSNYLALMHASADLDGTNWSTTQLHWTSLHSIYDPQLEVVGDKIYYVFSRRAGGSSDVLFTAYSDLDGSNFSLTMRDVSDMNVEPPQLQVVGEKIYYIYTIYKTATPYSQIFVASADLNGANWSTTQKTTSPYSKRCPQLEVVEDKIYYVWHELDDEAIFQIWIAAMNTDGSGWSVTKKTTSAHAKSFPQLDVEGSGEDEVIYYVWQEHDGSHTQIWTSVDISYIGYGEWLKFITAAEGVIPTGTRKIICACYSGYTYRTQASETDDGAEYVAYFVISTDLTNKKGLAYYKRILDLHLYFKNEISGTVKVVAKRDSEPAWQEVGEVSLTGIEEISIKHLATDVKAKHFLFKLSAANKFKFLGVLVEFTREGER